MQKLLDICTKYAVEHHILFNAVKSQCLIVRSRHFDCLPVIFYLSGAPLVFINEYKYLGHIITDTLTDDHDMLKQTRSLYARANMLIRRFSSARHMTKCLLFNSFCTPIYGCQLWCRYNAQTVNKLRVAYNDALRLLLQVPRWTRASQLFVDCRLPTFEALLRKHKFSLLNAIRQSTNVLLRSFVASDLYLRSKLMQKWRLDLKPPTAH